MNHYPPSIVRLIKNFSRLPGIGEKTAERLAIHVLNAPEEQARELSKSITEMKERVTLCRLCFNISENEVCRICDDPSRDDSLLCVVEQPAEMFAIEKSGVYKGLYHILQGALSPMNGIGPDNIRLKELLNRLSEGRIKEIVIATNTNVEGESTASYIAKQLENLPVRITRIASGVPMGGELKYVDQITLKKAMESRHAF